MAFTDAEIGKIIDELERYFWSKHRPPLELREQIREGQRIEGNSVVLFFDRPSFMDPKERNQDTIARAVYVKSRKVWKVYWMRADLKWHLYDPMREVTSFRAFLNLVSEDGYGCFMG